MSRSTTSMSAGRGLAHPILRRLGALATSGVLLFGVVGPLTPAVRATDESGDVSADDVAKTPNGNVTEAV